MVDPVVIPATNTVVNASKGLFSRKMFDLFFKWKLDDSLFEDLKTQFGIAKALLNDAEARQMEDDSYASWFRDARFALLDAEDLLDSIRTEKKKEQHQSIVSPGKLTVIKQKLRFKGNEIARAVHPFQKLRDTEMKKMTEKLKSITDGATRLGLNRTDMLERLREKRVSTSSDIHPLNIVGRSADEREIMRLLNSREGNDDALRVIFIIGMGGVGKTTLASMVYNGYKSASDQVFQVTAWVCVSDNFETLRVLRSLLESIPKEDSAATNTTLEACQIKLKTNLQDKRFLIVLDDIWNDVEDKWETLHTVFSVGAPGSRIIVTTREESVSALLSTSTASTYRLSGLSNDDGWLLLKRYAFQNDDSSSAYPNLENIGKEIVTKCKGSPLAIKMLGRALLSKGNEEKEWASVLHSKVWNSTNNILPSLWLSYYHLPLPIKQCFSYFSIFPKDYLFSLEEMSRLWIAERFLEKPDESSSRWVDYEGVARSYFQHLTANFFIEPSQWSSSSYVMHDLVHDLAEYISMDATVNWADVKSKSRRLPYIYDRRKLLNSRPVSKLRQLRTFLPGEYAYRDKYLFSNKVFNKLLSDFKFLRVLSLRRFQVSVLPSSIGDMKLLRYLNLSGTNIDHLPRWISRLYNLQVLDVSGCLRLKRLPKEFCDLVNLRHLIAKNTNFEEIPDGIGKMINLQTVPTFVVNKGESKKLRELGNLSYLQGKLKIKGLNNVDDLQDVVTVSFGTKQYLEDLVLVWESEDRNSAYDERILDDIRPHRNLKQLTIRGFGGQRFSDWIVNASPLFNGIESLSIFDCLNLSHRLVTRRFLSIFILQI